MKPIIGVLPLYDEVHESIWMLPGYLNLVEENGGIPLILPLTANKETWQPFLSLCDGFIFTGGQDIAPARYNEKTTDACGEVNQLRDEMEFQLMEEVIVRDKLLDYNNIGNFFIVLNSTQNTLGTDSLRKIFLCHAVFFSELL